MRQRSMSVTRSERGGNPKELVLAGIHGTNLMAASNWVDSSLMVQ